MIAPPTPTAQERVAVAVRVRPPLPHENRDPELEADEARGSMKAEGNPLTPGGRSS